VLTGCTGDSTSYTRFKFGACRPGQAAATVGSPDDLQAGKIELRVVQVMETGERKQEPLPASAAGPSSGADTQKLPDGKKVRSSTAAVGATAAWWCQRLQAQACVCRAQRNGYISAACWPVWTVRYQQYTQCTVLMGRNILHSVESATCQGWTSLSALRFCAFAVVPGAWLEGEQQARTLPSTDTV
jgi:hypothetical protein